MMVYIFSADVYCESCGEDIKAQIDAERAHNPQENPIIDDSDTYPQPHCGENCHDCPNHCGGQNECLEYIPIEDRTRIGALLTDSLTPDGVAYVTDTHRENPSLVTGLWMAKFEIPVLMPDFEMDLIRDEIEEMLGETLDDSNIVITIGDERITFYRAQQSGINRGWDAKPVPMSGFTGCARETKDSNMGWIVTGLRRPE